VVAVGGTVTATVDDVDDTDVEAEKCGVGTKVS
jgi:hypothetical protein